MSTIKNVVLWGLVLAGLLAGGSASATNFAVLLSGSSDQPAAEVDCFRVELEDIDLAGLDSEGVTADGFRHKRPGATRFSHIVLKRGVTRSIPDGLDVWWQEVLSGKNTSRDIKVAIFSDSGDQGASFTYNFLDCFAGERRVYEEVGADGKVMLVEEFEFEPNGLQMYKAKQGKAGKTNPGKMSIMDDDGSVASDDTIERWSGGEPALILTGPFRNSRFHTTAPGDKLVTDISLDLPDDGPSQVICDWVNAAVQGKPWKKSMSMVDLSAKGKPVGKMYHYHECFPMRYVFPVLIKGNTVEAGPTLTIKAARVNIN